MKTIIAGLWLMSAVGGRAAEVAGNWIAEIRVKGADPQYARVKLQGQGSALSGSWNQMVVTGALAGDRLSLALTRGGAVAGTLTGTAGSDGFSGEGRLSGTAG